MAQIKTQDTFMYRKSQEVLELIFAISELMPENDKHLQSIKDIIFEEMVEIQIQMERGYHSRVFELEIETSVLVRACGLRIGQQIDLLKKSHFKEREYVNILAREFEEFKDLFIIWIHNIFKPKHTYDTWELMNRFS